MADGAMLPWASSNVNTAAVFTWNHFISLNRNWLQGPATPNFCHTFPHPTPGLSVPLPLSPHKPANSRQVTVFIL